MALLLCVYAWPSGWRRLAAAALRLPSPFPVPSLHLYSIQPHAPSTKFSLGQVTNVREAIRWLSYTYLYTRMRKNPLPYGVSWEELMADPTLEAARRRLVGEAARELRDRMARDVPDLTAGIGVSCGEGSPKTGSVQ